MVAGEYRMEKLGSNVLRGNENGFSIEFSGQPVQTVPDNRCNGLLLILCRKVKKMLSRLRQLKPQANQKSALDLLTAQKKQNRINGYLLMLHCLQKAKKMEMSDAEYTRMLQADPEFGKLLGTEKRMQSKTILRANFTYLNSHKIK